MGQLVQRQKWACGTTWSVTAIAASAIAHRLTFRRASTTSIRGTVPPLEEYSDWPTGCCPRAKRHPRSGFGSYACVSMEGASPPCRRMRGTEGLLDMAAARRRTRPAAEPQERGDHSTATTPRRNQATDTGSRLAASQAAPGRVPRKGMVTSFTPRKRCSPGVVMRSLRRRWSDGQPAADLAPPNAPHGRTLTCLAFEFHP
jgi:hypothetical protein